jgi:hypothetical protein
MEAAGMRLIKYGKQDAEFSIYDIADIHWGTRGCAKDRLQTDIDRIKRDPYSLFIVGGDYCDWITPGDKRWDPEAINEDVSVNDLSRISALLASSLVKMFLPIKDKCLGWCIGNHELKHMVKQSEMFIHEEICHVLKVPNMRYSGWVDLYFDHIAGLKHKVEMTTVKKPPKEYTARIRVFVHHGAGAAATAGGKINMLKRAVDMSEADLVMVGHLHEQIAKPFVRLKPNDDCSSITESVTMGLITGSYLRIYGPGYTSYGEVKLYSPTTLGATRARYSPLNKSMVVENRADGIG